MVLSRLLGLGAIGRSGHRFRYRAGKPAPEPTEWRPKLLLKQLMPTDGAVLDPRQPLELKPASGNGCVAAVLLVLGGFMFTFALAWGAAVVRDGGGWLAMLPGLFAIPFLLLGLGIFLMGGYFLLAMFNPKPRLTITPGILPPGFQGTLTWDVPKASQKSVRRIQVDLVCVESATYRVGTTSTTVTETIYHQPLVDSDDPEVIESGEVTLAIPDDAMPSFEAASNRITWQINLQCAIPRWPDIRGEFPVLVIGRSE